MFLSLSLLKSILDKMHSNQDNVNAVSSAPGTRQTLTEESPTQKIAAIRSTLTLDLVGVRHLRYRQPYNLWKIKNCKNWQDRVPGRRTDKCAETIKNERRTELLDDYRNKKLKNLVTK